MSSKRLSRASISTLSVEYNVSFSVSCTSACLNQSWPVFNIQEYCNLFFSASFNIRIPLQNVLTQKISFIFLLSFLAFSMYYKFSVIKVNVFINLFLAIVIMPTTLTCLRKFLILHILRNSSFIQSIAKTYIVFQSSKTILLFYTSLISGSTNSLCIFAILSIIALTFSTSKV